MERVFNNQVTTKQSMCVSYYETFREINHVFGFRYRH